MYIPGGFTDCPEVLYHPAFPTEFLYREKGVLQTDWHGLIRPGSIRPCIMGAMPNKAS